MAHFSPPEGQLLVTPNLHHTSDIAQAAPEPRVSGDIQTAHFPLGPPAKPRAPLLYDVGTGEVLEPRANARAAREARLSSQSPNFCHGGGNTEEIQWWWSYDTAWLSGIGKIRERWRARPGKYSAARALTLAIPPSERAAQCGTRTRVVKCGCKLLALKIGCNQRWLCDECRRTYYKRVSRRLLRATKMHSRREAQRRARHPRARKRFWVLLRLSVRHSGDIALDRRRCVDGWRKLRQWLHKRMGAFPFAQTWECTEGSDGRGHYHAHVIALWPYIDWSEVNAEWQRATGGHSVSLDIQVAKKGAFGAAIYAAKYASKGSTVCEFSPSLGARVAVANYNKRLVNASHRFWKPRPEPRCQCCKQLWELESKPRAYRQVEPAAWLRGQALLYGNDWRGEWQAKLQLE